MQKPTILALTFVTLAAAGARPTAAQPPTYKRDIPDSLATQATVTEAAALATAQQRVPRGKVAALEREKGTLMLLVRLQGAGQVGHRRGERRREDRRGAARRARIARGREEGGGRGREGSKGQGQKRGPEALTSRRRRGRVGLPCVGHVAGQRDVPPMHAGAVIPSCITARGSQGCAS